MKTHPLISKAIQKVLLHFPELGYFIFNWGIHEGMKGVNTFATDYKNLYFKKDYAESLTLNEIGGVILHEVMHCLFLHPTELGIRIKEGKDSNLWRLALECVVNSEVINLMRKTTEFKLPGEAISPLKKEDLYKKGYVYDASLHSLDSLSIYNILKEKVSEEDAQKMAETGDLAMDVVADNDQNSSQEARERAIATLEKLNSAGFLSCGMERLIKELKSSKTPWQRILQKFVSHQAQEGMGVVSWSKCDHRHPLTQNDFYIPGYVDHKIDNPTIVIDTSGSIGEQEIKKFASEIAKIKQYVDEVFVITCDAKIHENKKVANVNEILSKIKFKGGGGTDFRPVFKAVKKTPFMVFFTDGAGSYPDKAPKYPVLWVMTTEGFKPPFGKIAHYLS